MTDTTMPNWVSIEELFKRQIADENKEKYNAYNRVIELATEKEKLIESNKILAEDLKELDSIIRILKQHQWSFDNDPNIQLKKQVMGVLNKFDTP